MARPAICVPVSGRVIDTCVASVHTSLPLGPLELPNGSVSCLLSAHSGSWVLQTRFLSAWTM